MRLINLRDKNFRHQIYSSPFCLSPDFEWDRSCSQRGFTVYTDCFLNDSIKNMRGEKIAWLLEPVSIHSGAYEWLLSNRHYRFFNEVWTHDLVVINSIPNAKFVPTGATWIEIENHKIHHKTELCSFIASDKNFAPGHRFRQSVRSIIPYNIHSYGRGFNPLDKKIDGLSKYAFSISIENIQRDTYFSEKIIDCFLTGTIPIYWGTKKVDQYFDPNGIIHFDTISQLEEIIKAMSFDLYEDKMDAIKTNFEEAKRYILPELWGLQRERFEPPAVRQFYRQLRSFFR